MRVPAMRMTPRTQASCAVSGYGEHWVLINASPDLRQQIEARHILHSRHDLRSPPIEGIILTDADVDAIAGPLYLRERQPFTIYASERVSRLAPDIVLGEAAAASKRMRPSL